MTLPVEFQAVLPAVQALADSTSPDYRALVLFYMPGGPDCHAVMFPTDATEYAAYLATRGYLANANDGTNVLTGQGAALHPSLVKTAANFNAGKLAIVANLAPMVMPLNKSEYLGALPSQLPVNLFSHYDQQNAQYSGLPRVQGSATGLGGRLMDLVDPTYNAGEVIPSTISVSGQNLFMDGFDVRQYQVGTQSAGEFSQFINSETLDAVRGVAETSSGANKLEDVFAAKVQSGNATGHVVNTAINGIDPAGFPTTGIGQQFKMVARLIAARSAFGHRRDLFFVSLGGFDTHTNELATLPGLLTQADNALDAFYQCTKTLGAGGTSLEANVTTYTLGDFGRCLVPNDSGCDHGWGGHYFVIGGSVLGGHIYSKDDAHSVTVTKDVMPNIRFNGPHDAGQGRLLPTISNDEYEATLYKWFAQLPGEAMALVVPGLAQFTTPDLGFMSAGGVPAPAPAPAPAPPTVRPQSDPVAGVLGRSDTLGFFAEMGGFTCRGFDGDGTNGTNFTYLLVATGSGTEEPRDWMFGDGWMEAQCQDASAVRRFMGLSVERNDNQDYKNEYCLSYQGGALQAGTAHADGVFAPINAGPSFTFPAPSASCWMRLGRFAGVFKAEYSVNNKASWTTLHIFAAARSGPVYGRWGLSARNVPIVGAGLVGFSPEA